MDKWIEIKRTCELSEKRHLELYISLTRTFDKSLLRHKESQFRAFKHRDYMISFANEIGFCLWWSFRDFAFIEYIFVAENYRGRGIGSELLDSVKDSGKLVVLEIDETSNIDSFYRANGFVQCDVNYSPIQLNEAPPKKLALMSFNRALSELEYLDFISIISSDELQF